MSRRQLLNALTLFAVLFIGRVAIAADKPHPFDQRPQPWQRRGEPVLSARTTKQAWCRVVCYSPHVIYHDGRFRMWYLGTSVASRSNDMVMGYAESKDGLKWTEHERNPVLTGRDVPWGRIIQTPFVLFDAEEKIYKMWFVSGAGIGRDDAGKVVSNDQRLGYATSRDGISWKVRPEPIYVSGRSPSVIKEGPNRYRMWMGSSASAKSAWNDIYTTIYEFKSTDGINWQRSDQPVLTPKSPASSTVYPSVLRAIGRWQSLAGRSYQAGVFCDRRQDGFRRPLHIDPLCGRTPRQVSLVLFRPRPAERIHRRAGPKTQGRRGSLRPHWRRRHHEVADEIAEVQRTAATSGNVIKLAFSQTPRQARSSSFVLRAFLRRDGLSPSAPVARRYFGHSATRYSCRSATIQPFFGGRKS
jgi:hypothetical protein